MLNNFPRFRVVEVEKCDPTIVSVFGEKVWYSQDLKVWPKPSSGIFNVELPDVGKGQLVVFDIQGTVVYEYGETQCIASPHHGNSVIRIDVSGLPGGRYDVEIWPDRNMGSKLQTSSSSKVFYGTQVVKVE